MVAQLGLFGGSVEIVEREKKSKQSNHISKKQVKVKQKLIRKYSILEYAYSRLFNKLDINILEQKQRVIKGLIIAYPDEQQAEVIGTQKMNINQRVKFYTDFLGGWNG